MKAENGEVNFLAVGEACKAIFWLLQDERESLVLFWIISRADHAFYLRGISLLETAVVFSAAPVLIGDCSKHKTVSKFAVMSCKMVKTARQKYTLNYKSLCMYDKYIMANLLDTMR